MSSRRAIILFAVLLLVLFGIGWYLNAGGDEQNCPPSAPLDYNTGRAKTTGQAPKAVLTSETEQKIRNAAECSPGYSIHKIDEVGGIIDLWIELADTPTDYDEVMAYVADTIKSVVMITSYSTEIKVTAMQYRYIYTKPPGDTEWTRVVGSGKIHVFGSAVYLPLGQNGIVL